MQDTKDTLPNKEQKFLFGSPNVSSLSFQSIASSSLGNSPFGKKPTSGNSPSGFPGSGTKLFTTPHSADRDESTTEEDHEGPHFEPIIPLPEKIDVKTGEEDEEVMFSHRAKLYRFVAEDKQWKERGVGDIKLLKNRRSGKIRVLMRRDQVLKICANHQITAEMKLKPNAGSEKSWVWSTMADFSEQECRTEQLAVRFKSEDIAKQFKEKFKECQEMLKNSTLMESRVQPNSTDAKEDLVAKFSSAEGSWECSACMVNNDSNKVACTACGSVKAGAKPSQGQKEETKPLFEFGSGASFSSGGFTFGSGGINQGGDTKPAFTYGGSNKTKNQFSGFSFSFGTLKQGGIVSDQQSKATKSSFSSLFEPKPGNKAGNSKYDNERQEKPKNQTSVKAKKEETKTQQAEKGSGGTSQGDSKPVFTFGSHNQTSTPSSRVVFSFCSLDQGGNLSGQQTNTTPKSLITAKDGKNNEDTQKDAMAKFQPAKGSWECEICMVNNDSNKVECAACGSVKPAVGVHKEQKQDSKSLFPFGFGASSSGGVFSFGSGRTTQGGSKPIFTFGSRNSTSSPSSRVVFSFCSLDQGGNLSGQQTNTTPKSLITAKDGKNNEDTQKDAMAKFQPAKGSWECEICMVNNDSNKVECAACGSVKPAVGVHKEQKQDSKSLFPFGFGASSSGGVFSFGSGGTSQGDSKPVFTFGSHNQTSSPSSGVVFGFCSLDQGGNLSGQQTNTTPKSLITAKDGKNNEDTQKDAMAKFQPAKGSWECEICMVNNDSNKVECAACGSVKPAVGVHKEQKQDSKSLFPFGFGASSSGGVFSFGSDRTTQGNSKPVFTFGSHNQTSSPSSGVAFGFGFLDQGGNLSGQ